MIKEKVKTQKNLVERLRAIRDKINLDIENMTLDEEKEYLNKMSANWENSPKQTNK